MSSLLKPLVLLCAILAVVVAVPTVRETVERMVQPAFDLFDKRPPKRILILGNSRVYYHDMPYMVREIADSARSPVLYAITSRTWGGARFEDLWNDAGVRSLLRQHWDQVILQAESGAQTSEVAATSFLAYGEKLVSAATAGGSPVALIVNWAYAEPFYAALPPGTRAQHIAAIEAGHRALAARTGASLIETCQVWEEVQAATAHLALTYADGNHPTSEGSYLSALMVFGFLSEDGVGKATFRPSGVDQEAARIIKDAVAQHYGSGPG